MLQFLENQIYGNVITAWILAAMAILLLAGLVLSLRLVLLNRLPQPAAHADMSLPQVLRELIERLSPTFVVIAAIYVGSRVLSLPSAVEGFIESGFVIALFLQTAVWADRIAGAALLWRFATHRTKVQIRNAIALMQFILRVTIWSLALLLILDNVGFDVTALIAGLGIGGIAVALAAQNVLGDLFSSLAIVLDRPFEVGDFIVFDGQSGTVERIGIKTTRIRSLTGEQVVCANSDLIKTRIHNYKRMAERRILFRVNVVYDLPTELLERVPELIRQAIESQDRVRFERAHFAAFGEFALQFEAVYFVLSDQYGVYMDVQQAINLAIYRAFAENGVEFAFPTRPLLPRIQSAGEGDGDAAGRTPAAPLILQGPGASGRP